MNKFTAGCAEASRTTVEEEGTSPCVLCPMRPPLCEISLRIVPSVPPSRSVSAVVYAQLHIACARHAVVST